jgi:geranylgeranyl diphosphate synthase type II
MDRVSQPKTLSPVTLEETRQRVDVVLKSFFKDRIHDATHIDRAYGDLWKASSKLSAAGGKRLRPYMTLLTYQTMGGTQIDEIVPIAAALELLHLGLLVHDDIIDRDYIRYGVANISGIYNELYEPFIKDVPERQHFSDSAAILAGDLLLFGGHDLLLTSTLPAEKVRIAAKIFNNAVFVVAGGELLDTESGFRPYGSIDALTVARYKTAHYSFVTPLLMGARMANCSDTMCNKLEEFGINLGIGYQLVDDLLGVFGTESVTGKSAINDLREGKHTYLIEQFRKLASSAQLEKFEQLFGSDTLSEQGAQDLRKLLVESGAKQSVDLLVDTYMSRTLQTLKDVEIDDIYKKQFETLVGVALKRVF